MNASNPASTHAVPVHRREVLIPVVGAVLKGTISHPEGAVGLVLFAHGSGSSRLSPRNQAVARLLESCGVATLLFDLLTREEEAADDRTGHLRFDIPFLARRLVLATRWASEQPDLRHLGLGYFGASTGGAAALMAAAELGSAIEAVVSRGGRPDLAEPSLGRVESPTLLIVGGCDDFVLGLNRKALALLRAEKHLAVVHGAGHLFEERGALEEVSRLAADWFRRHFKAR